MTYHEINLFTLTNTSAEVIDRYGTSASFRDIELNRYGRRQTLLNSCQHGYVIQCAPNLIVTAETSVFLVIILLSLLIIVGLFLIKNIRDKGSTINNLKAKLVKRSENYDA